MSVFRKMDRYVGAYFLSSYLVCFMFFLGIFIVLDLVPRLDDILEASPAAQEKGQSLFVLVVRYYAFKIPEIFLQVAPYLTLMAAMFTITRLRKANELIPMVMAGVSIFRIVLPIFLLAALLTVTMITVQEYVASPFATSRLLAETFLLDHEERLVMPQQVMTGVDGRKITVNNFDVNAGVIGSIDISYIEERDNRQVYCVISGKNLRWLGKGKGWSMEEGYSEEERPAGDGGGGRVPLTHLDIDLTPEDIILFLKSPYDMSLKQIERLFTMNPSDLRLKILLHHHITFPLTNIILLLLGLPFVFRQEQHSNFLGITIALAICMGYFALDVIMRDLGTQGFLPAALAAWFSVVFCGSLGICIFDSIRT
jgi:lipopolysaccharide export system permease protein